MKPLCIDLFCGLGGWSEGFIAEKMAFSYEQKLMAMRYFPVSSLMTNLQFKKYCEDMQNHFINRVQLEFPKEKK